MNNQELPFRLPSKPAKVYTTIHEHSPFHHHQRYGTQWQQEAERIAWRICKTWLEAQITLVNLEQAKMEEVFLPYFVVGRKNESLYEVMKGKNFLLPDGSK